MEGEEIECPFHKFRFNKGGVCTRTGYESKPPKNARVRTWPLHERNGQLLVYYDAEGNDPSWEVPVLDWEGWTPLIFDQWRGRTHPQEAAENSVDIGHFPIVHGYHDVQEVTPIETEGAYLTTRYSFKRKNDVFGGVPEIKSTIHVQVWGLGYSLVDVSVDPFGLRARVWVLPAPTDGEFIQLRAAVSVYERLEPRQIHWGLGLLPRKLAIKLIRKAAFKGYKDDLHQDFKIWENKKYVHPPVLAKGDGPIAPYRKWARQFYPALRRADSATPAATPEVPAVKQQGMSTPR